MSQFLVLTHFVGGSQPSERIPAGTIIDDTQFVDFAQMVAGGLAAIPYDASMDAAISAFRAQLPAGVGAELIANLTAAGIVTPGGGVPATRNLIAGAGLTGGGTLAADRTFNVVANADNSITVNANDVQVGILASDAQHGVRGGGTQHAVVVDGAAGFAPAGTVAALGKDVAAKVFADSPYAAARTLSVLELTTTAGVIVVNLPTLASAQGQRLLVIDATGNFAVNKATLTPDGAEKINGVAAPFDLASANEKVYVVAGATSWWIIKSA